MQQIFLLESFYALIILPMEIPSGYFADRYGRVMVLVGGRAVFGLVLVIVDMGSGDFSGC